tara:strand:- start:453 stop:917 length:465 start_codon:yes stop_codon:yes gene_type:complete
MHWENRLLKILEYSFDLVFNNIKIMKIFITLLIIFFSSSTFAKVYYCVEEAATGFDGGNNYKQTEFQTGKFTADIDFDNLSLIAEDIMIKTYLEGHTCSNDFENQYMQCFNSWGYTFLINKTNLKFVHSAGLGYIYNGESDDDLILSFGQCSLF